MLLNRLLADLVLFVHAAFVLFVMVALVLTLVGLGLKWAWVRNFWFRMAHLLAIGVVVGQAWVGQMCPLTILERMLRERAGQTTYPGDFIAYWVYKLLFYRAEPWVFTVSYTVFGLLVVATFVLGPPRRPSRKVKCV